MATIAENTNIYSLLNEETTEQDTFQIVKPKKSKKSKEQQLKRTDSVAPKQFTAMISAAEAVEAKPSRVFSETLLEEDALKPLPMMRSDDFPELGATVDTKKEKKEKRAVAAKPVTFMVSSSRIAELKEQQPQRRQTRPGSEARTGGFTRLQNKDEMAKTLVCTKPCQFCERKVAEDGSVSEEWGVCYREICTFAHSISELQLAPCAFGKNCRRRDGTYDRETGKTNKSKPARCQFKHPDESTDQFYTRTGRDKPDLPATSEKTRQPKPRKTTNLKPVLKTAVVKPCDRPQTPAVETSRAPTPALSTASTTVKIHVPKCMQQSALEMCISKGMTDFEIVLTD